MKYVIAFFTVSLFLVVSFIMLGLVSCTYSVNVAHTEGTTSDLIDETQSNEPDISPNISLPIPAL